MASQTQFTSGSHTAPTRAGGPEHPPCPQCQRRMIVKLVTPVLFASDIDEVTYTCERCGTETKRTVNRG